MARSKLFLFKSDGSGQRLNTGIRFATIFARQSFIAFLLDGIRCQNRFVKPCWKILKTVGRCSLFCETLVCYIVVFAFSTNCSRDPRQLSQKKRIVVETDNVRDSRFVYFPFLLCCFFFFLVVFLLRFDIYSFLINALQCGFRKMKTA